MTQYVVDSHGISIYQTSDVPTSDNDNLNRSSKITTDHDSILYSRRGINLRKKWASPEGWKSSGEWRALSCFYAQLEGKISDENQ